MPFISLLWPIYIWRKPPTKQYIWIIEWNRIWIIKKQCWLSTIIFNLCRSLEEILIAAWPTTRLVSLLPHLHLMFRSIYFVVYVNNSSRLDKYRLLALHAKTAFHFIMKILMIIFITNRNITRNNYISLPVLRPFSSSSLVMVAIKTRYVDGTQTSEVTPVNIPTSPWLPMGRVMVMNDRLTSLSFHVSQPSHSLKNLFQTLILKLQGQGHGCGQRARQHS